MAIRIDEDGTIINGDEQITSSGTIIREDGTIESSNIGAVPAPQRRYISLEAPVSPLENGGSRSNQATTQEPVSNPSPDASSTYQRGSNPNAKSIADLEYDLMIAEGHIKGAVSMTPIIMCIVAILIGIIIHPVFFIGAIVAAGMIFTQFSKKSTYEAEAQKIRNDIENLKRK